MTRLRIAFAFLLVAAGLAACVRTSTAPRAAAPPTTTPAKAEQPPMDLEITVEQAKQQLDSGQAVLVDVREPWELQTASIRGAKHIPMGEVAARAHNELDPDARILVVCHHGRRSLEVTNWLRQQGFGKAQSVRGGIHAWSQKIDPSVPVY